MPQYTQNLSLFKYNTNTDAKEVFSIDKALNDNWERLDTNTLNHANLTNCITQLPNRINLQLQGNTLTLKKGSVLIVPYGTKDLTSQYPVDSQFLNNNFKVVHTQFVSGKFFVWVELQNDKSRQAFGTVTSGDIYINVVIGTGGLSYCTVASANCGTTPPVAGNYYETNNNRLVNYTESQIGDQRTLPIAWVSAVSGQIVEIKQIFNGCGTFGQLVWCDKDVKALIPNGWTKLGTFNNVELHTTKLSTLITTQKSNPSYIFIDSNGNLSQWRCNGGNVDEYEYLPKTPAISNIKAYIQNENFWWHAADKGVWTQKLLITPLMSVISNANAQITTLEYKRTMHLVDMNTFKRTLQDVATVIESFQDGFSGYRLWSDGYCEQWGNISHTSASFTVNLLKTYKDTFYNISLTGAIDQTGNYYDVKTWYPLNTPKSFIIYSSHYQAPRYEVMWRTCGFTK